MRLFNVRGKLVNKNVTRYSIDWDGESKSKIQFQVKQFLKPFWSGHVVYEEFPVYGTLLKVDILNATLHVAVEVNGPQHNNFHFFHNKEPFNYLDSFKRDVQKMEWLEKNHFQLIEIEWDEVDKLSEEFFLKNFSLKL